MLLIFGFGVASGFLGYLVWDSWCYGRGIGRYRQEYTATYGDR